MKPLTTPLATALVAAILIGCGGGIESKPTITARPAGTPGNGGGNGGQDGKNGKGPSTGGFGTLTGTIKYSGGKPNIGLPNGYVKKDPFCTRNESKIKDESLIVGDDMGLANVVIFLPRKPKRGKNVAAPKTPAVFDQVNCTFIPHVLLVRVRQPLMIKNSDQTSHNTHTYPNANAVENTSLGAGKSATFSYVQREEVPVKVGCDVHPWMSAYHVTLDHPYAAVTGKDGKFTIADLPAGTHEFIVWHEKKGTVEKVKVTIEADKTATLDRSYGQPQLTGFAGPRSKYIVFSTRK